MAAPLCVSSDPSLLATAGKLGTLRRVGNFWLPHLQQLDVQCPVILCGCKSDLNILDQEQLQEVSSTVSTVYAVRSQRALCMHRFARLWQSSTSLSLLSCFMIARED